MGHILLDHLFVGKPVTLGEKDAKHPMDREWTSSIFKKPADEALWLSENNLAGDAQADLKHHGGPEKAVFCYPSEHYLYWQKEFPEKGMVPGGMGENFSIAGQTESAVAIGDIYEVGGAIIQVSQPRQPCWKPARRFGIKPLSLLIQRSGRTGWYYRVLQEGYVEPGNTLEMTDRPYAKWTIETCNEVMHEDRHNLKLAEELAQCDSLAVNWKNTLRRRVEKGHPEDIQNRVVGPNE